jgi:hypothetical protein
MINILVLLLIGVLEFLNYYQTYFRNICFPRAFTVSCVV